MLLMEHATIEGGRLILRPGEVLFRSCHLRFVDIRVEGGRAESPLFRDCRFEGVRNYAQLREQGVIAESVDLDSDTYRFRRPPTA